MSGHERRLSMALDDAYNYCRSLETGRQRPESLKICAALATVKSALESIVSENHTAPKLSLEAWSRIHFTLFDFLLRTTAGHFLIYKDHEANPLEPGSPWPETGFLEFHPAIGRRRNDSFLVELDQIGNLTKTTLRWCFAEGRTDSKPSDFNTKLIKQEEEEEEVNSLINQFYDICAKEVQRGKKKAHRQWWELYWQANSCQNKQERRRLHKDMDKLQSIWGRPS